MDTYEFFFIRVHEEFLLKLVYLQELLGRPSWLHQK